jgi:hypothetical protein
MPILRIRRHHDPRLLAPDHVDDGELLLASGAQAAVAEVERLTELGAQDLRGARRLLRADLGGAAGAHLAARQVDDAETVAALVHLHERAAARQLDVVGVSRDREDVNRHAPLRVHPRRRPRRRRLFSILRPRRAARRALRRRAPSADERRIDALRRDPARRE